MMKYIKRSKPADSELSKHLYALHDSSNLGKQTRAPRKLTADIASVHQTLYGDVENVPNPEDAAKLVSKLLDADTDLFMRLAQNVEFLEFDAKKQTADILDYIVRRCGRNEAHIYIQSKTNKHGENPIITALLRQYSQNMSSTLHEMVRRPELSHMLLHQVRITKHAAAAKRVPISVADEAKYDSACSVSSISINSPMSPSMATEQHFNLLPKKREVSDLVEELIELAQDPCFSVSNDAYNTLHQLLVYGKSDEVCLYLQANYQRFFDRINKLICMDHYMNQRQFLKLLRDLFTKRQNYDIMMKYISRKSNLAIMMTLMKKYKDNAISLEAYDVFKLFVANPRKTNSIIVILWKNKHRIIELLRTFHDDQAQKDSGFAMDREMVTRHISAICLPEELKRKSFKQRSQ